MWLNGELKKLCKDVKVLAEGSILVRTDPKSDTLFSCHIDTCHSQAESEESVGQGLAFDPAFNHMFLADPKTSGCLGADDGAGVYVCMELIKAEVPGSYLFHVGEEVGGIGANAVVAKHTDLLEEFSRAIAFDRGGTGDVVVTQGGDSCASAAFGTELASQLNKCGMHYAVSHGGSFTDVKLYRGVIPECVNLSVGYSKQHGPAEFLNVEHLLDLVEACKKIKWDELKVVRKPVIVKVEPTLYRFDASAPKPAKPQKAKKGKSTQGLRSGAGMYTPSMLAPSLEEVLDYTIDEIIDLVSGDPDAAVTIIIDLMAALDGETAKYERARKLLGFT
jgi:hypothetical protein